MERRWGYSPVTSPPPDGLTQHLRPCAPAAQCLRNIFSLSDMLALLADRAVPPATEHHSCGLVRSSSLCVKVVCTEHAVRPLCWSIRSSPTGILGLGCWILGPASESSLPIRSRYTQRLQDQAIAPKHSFSSQRAYIQSTRLHWMLDFVQRFVAGYVSFPLTSIPHDLCKNHASCHLRVAGRRFARGWRSETAKSRK